VIRLVLVSLAALALLVGCARKPPAPEEARLVLEPAEYADLVGWGEDALADAWPALQKSCGVAARRDPAQETLNGITIADWQRACAAIGTSVTGTVPAPSTAALRAAIETAFRPFRATAGGNPTGLFTGYYEIELAGSRIPDPQNRYPLYRRPPDLVSVDLGEFRDGLKGQRIAGRVIGDSLKPYPDRGQIDRGALANKGLEIAWVADPVDAFFLHIQGSGRVHLNDGSTIRVGYAAQNGHPYLAIGRPLIDRGAIPADRVSMQSIRAWLLANPDEAERVMWLNASYVFFREVAGDGPIGAQGLPLTPGRSIAVDPRSVPLGTPVWLDTTAPSATAGEVDRPLRRLMVAQDTGGAIKGAVRGDVFWGHGPEAGEIAGRMKQPGRWWLLLPRTNYRGS
jgi:membrane-bound lytic murein transglycosylase A